MLDNKGKLSQLGVFSLAISGIAPTGCMAYSTVATAEFAGYNIPLSFLVGGLGILCVAICFASMAKYVANAGSVYAYNRQAFGEKGGFITGWILTFAYVIMFVSLIPVCANFANVFLRHVGLHFAIPLLTFIFLLIFWVVSLLGIKLTSQVTLYTEGVSLCILIVLSIVILYKAGISNTLTLKPFIPHHNFSGIGQGMIFAILSLTGFEEVSTVATQTKNPKKLIPKALVKTVVIVSIFFVIVTFVQVIGYGVNNMAAYTKASAPLDALSIKYLGNLMAIIMDFAVFLSCIASVFGCGNACAYMLYALGKRHYLPKQLGEFDDHLNSPKNAINITAVLFIILYSTIGIPEGFQFIYRNASTLAVLGYLLVYMMVCVGSFFYFRKVHRNEFSWIKHFIIPLLGIAVLVLPVISNTYPVPAFPANLFPYIIIGWIVIGLIVAHYRMPQNDR